MPLLNFNFRIDQTYKDKLALLRGYYKNYFANSSDLVRHLVDDAINRKLEQERYFAPDLRIIGQKIDQAALLRHDEIRFLAFHANAAYKGCIPQAILNPAYIADNIKAFFALLPHMVLSQEERKECWSNLPEFQHAHPPLDLCDAFFEQTGHCLQDYNAEIMSRNLLYLADRREFLNVPAFRLNELLDPYKKSLLTLSKKALLIKRKQPLFHYTDRYVFQYEIFGEAVLERSPLIEHYEEGLAKVGIVIRSDPTCGIHLRNSAGHSYFSTALDFPETNDLIKLFSSPKIALSTHGMLAGEYFRFSFDGESYHWSCKHFMLSLIPPDFFALKTALLAAAERIKDALPALRLQWGDF